MRLMAICCVLTLLCAQVQAATVPVRSGEHDGFSRLVFYFDRGVDWSLQRIGSDYELHHTEGPTDYQIEDVFRLIPRTRLSDVSFRDEGRVVVLHLACPCTATAFQLIGGQVVIDIADPGPPGPIARNAPSAPVAPEVLRGPLGGFAEGPGPVEVDGVAPRSVVEAQMLRGLAEGLGRASAQGLVAADPAVPVTHHGEGAAQTMGTAAGGVEAHGETGLVQMRTVTQMDLDTSWANDAPDVGQSCRVPVPYLDVVGWGQSDNPWRDLAQKRLGLVSAGFQSDADGRIALARGYVWLGFGAEALEVLESHDGGSEDRVAAVQFLARVMDEIEGLQTEDYAAQLNGCDGSAALWAVLAGGGRGAPSGQAVEAAIDAFGRLPRHLRRHLGPRLYDRFRALGMLDAAATIANAVDRIAVPKAAPDSLVAAQEHLAQGQWQEAEAVLLGLLRAATGVEVEAAHILAAQYERRDARPDPILVDVLQAMATSGFEDVERASHPWLVKMLVLSDRPREAASWLDAAGFVEDTSQRGVLYDALIRILEVADDITAAELAFRYRKISQEADAPPQLRRLTDARLAALGLATGLADLRSQPLAGPPATQAGPVAVPSQDIWPNGQEALIAQLHDLTYAPSSGSSSPDAILDDTARLLDRSRAQSAVIQALLENVPDS